MSSVTTQTQQKARNIKKENSSWRVVSLDKYLRISETLQQLRVETKSDNFNNSSGPLKFKDEDADGAPDACVSEILSTTKGKVFSSELS